MARYLLPSEVTKRLPIPGPGSGSPISRVKAVYEALLRVDGTSVRYAFEKDVVIDGSQVVRTPAEVLVFPGNGTCLDLALVLAAALHAAQLPVAVVVLDDGSEQARRHALVAVHVGTECPTWWSNHSKETVVWTEPPPGLREELADSFDGPGDVLLIDPNGVSVDLGTSPAVGLDASFADAVSHGADYFGSWQWLVGVVPGSSVEPFHPADAPSNDPLAVPYLDPQSANGPLEYLRPEYRAIPFQGRNERTILEDLAEDALTLSQTRVAIVHGAGGSGKTRLALEVADRLRREGWYAGVLPQGARDVEWLAQVVTPLCLVVDYAEGRLGKPDAPGDVRRLLGALRARRPGLPVLLILTARTVTGGWVEELHNELQNQRQFAVETRVPLPNKHPDSGDLYKRTVLTLNPDTAAASLPAVGPSWTTLDYILLGWLAANTTSELPARKADLYDSALAHEAKYWVSVYRGLGYELDDQGNRQEIEPDRPRLRLAAAALTLAQAEPDVVDEILATLPSLKTKERERALIERTLLQCLANSEIVAVRPDPIGDHLVLTDLTNTPNSAAFAALTAPEAVWTRALSTINRAGQNDHSHATAVIGQMLTSHPDRWPAALDLALLQGGPVSEAIESHVHSMAPVLPLDHLSEAIPFTELITSPLGLHVDQARLASARQTDQPPHVLAALLQRVAERHRLLGDPAGALAAIEEAVTLRR
ncbi:MAG TPA: ATP-binding protein, partial [Dermatophilaceae bacterium]|nr:ATP-binding protein [Dermatophilaceae bacterium]